MKPLGAKLPVGNMRTVSSLLVYIYKTDHRLELEHRGAAEDGEKLIITVKNCLQ